ncbi:MAG: hypothetical protein IJN49_04220, partial [Clostridia bacterium]|nr:hypothetical protein [Clostridia bacterium]
MKKRQKNLTKPAKLPLLILFIICFLFIGLLQSERVVPIYEQLGQMAVFLMCFYLFIIFFDFVSVLLNKVSESKKEDNNEEITDGQTVIEEKKKLKKFTDLLKLKKKNEKNIEKKLKFKKIALIVTEVLYVLIQIFFIMNMALSSFSLNLQILSKQEHEYTFGNIGVLLVVAMCLLVYRSFILQKSERKASKTVSTIFFVIGGMAIAYIGIAVLNIILEMDFCNVAFWFYRICSIYLALVLLIDLFISVIKKETLKSFNYEFYLPKLNLRKKGENGTKKSILDTLEEHTGISIKSLWSLRYVGEILPAAILAIIAVLFVSTCIYKVEPYEQAAVYRFGSLEESSIKSEGLHFKLPWPIEKAEIYEVKRVQNMTIGYESNDTLDNMWTESHSVEEYKLLTGNGNELVSVNIKLVYKIDDLYTYLTKSASPESLLSSKAYEFMMNKTNSTNLDTILSVDRIGLSKELLKALNGYTKENAVGLKVEEVIVESIHPPVELSDVYQSVVSADVKKTTAITNAESEAQSLILDAEKDAKTVVIKAKENQTTKVADATNEMEVYKNK